MRSLVLVCSSCFSLFVRFANCVLFGYLNFNYVLCITIWFELRVVCGICWIVVAMWEWTVDVCTLVVILICRCGWLS